MYILFYKNQLPPLFLSFSHFFPSSAQSKNTHTQKWTVAATTASNKQQEDQGQPSHSQPLQPRAYQQLLNQQQQQLQMFWSYQRQEIEQVNDFRNHQLPLARIKKIMKADEDVRMISAEAPVLFAKACELFILELTIRSWLHSEENRRRTLQKNDIAAAITGTDIFDFLVDIVPRDEIREGEMIAGVGGGGASVGVVPNPYFYSPVMGSMGVMMGRSVGDQQVGAFVGPPSQAWQSVWQNEEGSGYGNGGGENGGGQGNTDGQS